MAEDVTGVSSTPTAEAPLAPMDQAIANDNVSEYRQVRQAERAGKELPQIAPKPAESAPAPPVDQAASTDAIDKPASEPGKPKDKGIKARSAELDRENAELREKLRVRALLREELARGPQDATPAASSPAPAKTSKPYERFMAMPDAPKLDDYQSFEHWQVDMTDFVDEVKYRERSERQQQDQQTQTHQKFVDESLAKGRAAHADFDEVTQQAYEAGYRFPAFAAPLFTHERWPDIAYALAKDQITDQLRQMEVITGLVNQSKPSTPPVSTITKAPEPPITLGSRPHDKADELERAITEGDTSAYRAARLRERMAARR